MAQNVPLYKYTQLPRSTTTDVQSAYFGQQAQKSRRESQLAAARTDLNAGTINLDSFQQVASRVLGNSVGLPERLGAIDVAQKGLNTKVQTDYNTLTAQYEQGKLPYEEYIQGVKDLGSTLTTNISNNPDYVASTEPIDNYKIGDYTIGDILSGAKSNYLVQQENQKADDYAKGKISFEDYAGFLNNQLNFYADTTTQDETLKRVWEDAYSTELGRYYNEIVAKHDAGQMTEPEYADFLNWYSGQVDQGAQQSTEFTRFKPGEYAAETSAGSKTGSSNVNGSVGKDLSGVDQSVLRDRIAKQQNKFTVAKSKGDTAAMREAKKIINRIDTELRSREKRKKK